MVWFPPLLVVIDACGGGQEAAEDGDAAGTTDRGGTVGVCERGAAGSKAIEVWGVNLAGIAAEVADPVVEIVDGEEEDVGGLGGSKVPEARGEEQGKGQQAFHEREARFAIGGVLGQRCHFL
jgi:hypothetical protein